MHMRFNSSSSPFTIKPDGSFDAIIASYEMDYGCKFKDSNELLVCLFPSRMLLTDLDMFVNP